MKRSFIDPNTKKLSISKQLFLIGLSKTGFYYQKKPISDKCHRVMEEIDAIYTDHPYYGTRKIKETLKDRSIYVGRAKIAKLMKYMGIEAIYPKKNLSLPNKEHKKYPYLLRDVEIREPNHVFSTDITYIRLKKGFAYLVAVIDWYSRYVLSWKLSTTMDGGFCREALKDALEISHPQIFNTDQGSQFTDKKFLKILEEKKIEISMDGKGRALDNVFIERLWRTVKYEDIYLRRYESVKECREGLKKYFDFYNYRRKHQSHNYKTPAEIYQTQNGINLTEKQA